MLRLEPTIDLIAGEPVRQRIPHFRKPSNFGRLVSRVSGAPGLGARLLW